jgi:methyl-accepting chemotaxis protein
MSICITNSNGFIEFVNDEFTNQTGYTMDEVLDKRPKDILQGRRSQESVKKEIAEAIKNSKRFEGEIINYNKIGDEITCKLIIAPILDRNDVIEKYISLAVFKKKLS